MYSLLMILLCVSASQAIPIWINRYHTSPLSFHFLRQPSISFGSGFSSDIGGYRHSSGVAFQSGNGQAYGAGVADGGNSRAYARAVASPPNSMFPYDYRVPVSYYPSISASASSSSPRFNGLSSATSSSSTRNIQNAAATSTANSFGSSFPGHNLAVSTAQNINGQKSSFSLSQLQNGSGFRSAVSLANDFGGVKSSMAQTTQVQGAAVQHSGASSISAPGFHNAHSHALGYGSF